MTQTILIATCCTLAALLTVCAIFLFKRHPEPAPDETIKLDLANLQRPTFALRLPHSKKVLHLTLPSKADTDRITQLSEGIDGSAVHDAASEALYMDKLTEAAAIMLSSNAEGKRIGRSWLARHCTNDDIAILVGQYMAWLVDILQEKN